MAPHLPSRQDVARLLSWSPEHGVVTVWVRVEPGERGQPWRQELRGHLRELIAAAERPQRALLERTAKRILARFPEGGNPPGERGQIGFVEVGGEREEWHSTRMPPPETGVALRPRPAIMPLLAALDEGRARAIAIVSGERVRLALWQAGALEEVEAFELETLAGDWRERKAMRPPDPAREQGVSSSGRDRYDQRLEHNRKLFLVEVGRLIGARARALGVREVLALGPRELTAELEHGLGSDGSLHAEELDHRDLISASLAELEGRVTELVRERSERRQLELIATAIDRAGADLRAALGPEPIAHALVEGRVEHLLIDRSGAMPAARGDGTLAAAAGSSAGAPAGSSPERRPGADEASAYLEQRGPGAPRGGVPARPSAEWLIERALETSATITTLSGEAAERARAVGGVAALLRY
jgi:hypothetical protein